MSDQDCRNNAERTHSLTESSISSEKSFINGAAGSLQRGKEEEEQHRNTHNDGSPIIYHYLEFDTPLPSPIASSITTAPPPPEPDLRAYTSPFDWPSHRKSFIVWTSCVATILTAFTAGASSPGTAQMASEWAVSPTAILANIAAFTTGFALAPMVLAPFSEINGRRPVFVASGALFVAAQLASGLSPSYAGFLAARVVAGVGGSTFSTMVGGVIADMYHAEARNTPMALFSGAALFGTGCGPLVGGFVTEALGWRWVFHVQVVADAVLVAVVAAFFRETRGSVLLSRKARAVNAWYEAREAAGHVGVLMPRAAGCPSCDSTRTTYRPERIRWKVRADEERRSLAVMVGISLYRPFHLLVTESVVFWFSLWISFSWAVLYLTLAAVPLVFSNHYGFTTAQSGAVFASLSVGAVLATILSIVQEKMRTRGRSRNRNDDKPSDASDDNDVAPERRLHFACIESALMPAGLLIFGWTATPSIPFIIPCLALALATMGIFSIYLAVFNYLADVYHRYASSALAAQSCCRNLLGGAFPLVTAPLFERLGYGGAASFLGGVGALLTLVPWVLVLYGPAIRRRSKIASEISRGG